jgi:hypothetical protein
VLPLSIKNACFVLTNPCSVQINGYKWWWDGEIVHKWIQFQHEPKFVTGCNELKEKKRKEKAPLDISFIFFYTIYVYLFGTYPDKEVDHEEDIES